MKRLAFNLAAFAVAGATFLTLAQPADAAMVLRLTHVESATTVTVTDGGAGDSNPAVGAITFIGAVGVFEINVSTGLSKPILPADPFFAQMDLNSINTSTSAGTLVIELTDTDFPATGAGVFEGVVGGTVGAGATAEFWAWKDPENREFGESDIELHIGPFGPGLLGFAGSDSTTHDELSPYSMTARAVLVHGPGVTVSSFDFNIVNRSVPEPGSLILLGTGLVVLGAAVSRRRSRKKDAATG